MTQRDRPVGRKGRWGTGLRTRWRIGLAVLALLLAVPATVMQAHDVRTRVVDAARSAALRAVRVGVPAVLSYTPDHPERLLDEAHRWLTGPLRDSFVETAAASVIPGARARREHSTATVADAATVSATPDRAVVLAFVDRRLVTGDDPPADGASSLRVTLNRVDGAWLIAGLDGL